MAIGELLIVPPGTPGKPARVAEAVSSAAPFFFFAFVVLVFAGLALATVLEAGASMLVAF